LPWRWKEAAFQVWNLHQQKQRGTNFGISDFGVTKE
jgi:hypothetical protein